MLCTNHKPEVRGTDHAIWRRPKLLPFTVTIPESEAIPDLMNQLQAEFPGILARCVRGGRDWQKNGLKVPSEVTQATSSYRAEQDTLAAFLAEECLLGNSYRTRASPLYERYRSATEGLGKSPMSQTSFGLALKERGFEKLQSNGIWYLGIGLRHDEPFT
jgi:putative DNA primase/helicase